MSEIEEAAIPCFLDGEDADGGGRDAVAYARVFYQRGSCQPEMILYGLANVCARHSKTVT